VLEAHWLGVLVHPKIAPEMKFPGEQAPDLLSLHASHSIALTQFKLTLPDQTKTASYRPFLEYTLGGPANFPSLDMPLQL